MTSPLVVLTSLVRVVAGLVFLSTTALVLILAMLVLLPWRLARIRLVNRYGHLLGLSLARVAGIVPRVQDRERLEGSMPAIFVANHTSTLDVLLCIWMCPVGACGVMKREILRIPFFGWLYFLSGHLWINRADRGSAVAALGELAAFVRENRLGVWIMPEGTRSKDGRLLPFKKGFVHLAVASGLPVVPVVIHGAHRAWQKGTLLQLRSMPIEIEVLPPVDTSGWREETAEAHAREVHNLVAARLEPDQRPSAAS